MIAYITLTPVSNLLEHDIVDPGKIIKIEKDWNEAILVWDESGSFADAHRERMVGVQDISVYDHLPIIDGVRHRILGMISKNPPQPEPAGCRCYH